jgi:hypothetical protein
VIVPSKSLRWVAEKGSWANQRAAAASPTAYGGPKNGAQSDDPRSGLLKGR